MEHFMTVEGWVAFLTLASLEIVLGIDNIIFITILTGRLPEAQRGKAMRLGLGLAMFMRVGLLLAIGWIMKLKETLFTLAGHGFTGKDLILLGGGLFLLAKSTHEIHNKLEGPEHAENGKAKAGTSFAAIIAQILALDIVFSLDSVITAVGMAPDMVSVMIAAIVVAVAVMMVAARPVAEFVERHPTMKMLALSFLLLIGVMLVGEGFGKHIEKGYIYFAMGFSVAVELLNMKMRKAKAPVKLHNSVEISKLPQ